jgi:hypothetical protein
MSLTVSSYTMAETQFQLPPQLRSLLGGYELSFYINAAVNPPHTVPHWITVHSARVLLRVPGAQPCELGVARTDAPKIIYQRPDFVRTEGIHLRLALTPQQMEALEACRNGGDLDFELKLACIGGTFEHGQTDRIEEQSLYVQVPKSAWIAQLNDAQILRILLLEIPMPYTDAPAKPHAVEGHLRQAQKRFVDGNYGDCVSECRKATEELEQPAQKGVLARLARREDREAMDRDDRGHAILAAIQNYTHLAMHSASKGGAADFNRADAKLILSLTAAFAAFRLGRS